MNSMLIAPAERFPVIVRKPVIPNSILCGDALRVLKKFPDGCIQTCVTSPPYFGLRNYGIDGQIGLEETPEVFVNKVVEVFREVRRVLRDDGTLWLNLGDSYATGTTAMSQQSKTPSVGLNHSKVQSSVSRIGNSKGIKIKDLIGVPWMVAFALREDGWYLRQDIIWQKTNPMPESVGDRCTKSHEYIFLLSKSKKYYYDNEAVKEDAQGGIKGKASSFKRKGSKRGNSICPNSPTPTHRENRDDIAYDGPKRNRRDVWAVATNPYRGAHFATFPPKLIEPCILAGTSEKGCCSKCGAPLKRIVKKSGGLDWRNDEIKDKGVVREIMGDGGNKRGPSSFALGSIQAVETIEWKSSCKCDAYVVPCLVLDPFMGSGTSGLVAKNNNQDFVGIELNSEYIELAKKRIYE